MTYESDNHRVVEALRFGGCKVTDVYALVNSPGDDSRAVPILIALLPTVEDLKVREGILRALSMPAAAGGGTAKVVVEEFKRALEQGAPPLGVPWAAANALSIVADDTVVDDLIVLIRDPRAGKAREMLALALGRTRNPRAVDVLVESLRDDELVGHAIAALTQLGAVSARSEIEKFADHPKAWVRNEAQKALRKLSS